MKRKNLFVTGLLLGIYALLPAQPLVWKVGVHSFFDNMEFGGSAIRIPQTMSGVHLAPEIGLVWEDKHRIFAGTDLMYEYGSSKVIAYYAPLIYYEYAGELFRFYAGAIPRSIIPDRYPRMFFRDSIMNYRPVINGIFWEYGFGNNYANVWLDWTGRQTDTRREAFFMGWSGKYNYRRFYAQHSAYMFHFAKTRNPAADESIHDMGLLLTSLGVDYSGEAGFEKLEANLGWSMGLDRNRGVGVWNKPQGLLSEIKVEYKGTGLFNTYYRGDAQQIYYNDFGSKLYWGDPAYRSKAYDRLDLYICFINTGVVKLKFIYSMHFMEKQLYHGQAFYATFDLSNLKDRKPGKKYQYLWENWF
ncbi:MAG: hypothetical protein LBS88_03440 [Tannerellaceae bacterium]|jgi:hypothetical protein|nr:hypothetical protein [Tannerellaceae bacterium]